MGTVVRKSQNDTASWASWGCWGCWGRCPPWLFLARSSAASEAHTSDVSRCCKSLAQHELPDKQAGWRFKWQGWASSAVARRLHAAQPAREPASQRAVRATVFADTPHQSVSPMTAFLPLPGWGWLAGWLVDARWALPRLIRQFRTVSGRQGAFHPACCFDGCGSGKQKAVHHRAISWYIDVRAGASPWPASQPTHSSLSALRATQGFGELGRPGVWREGCAWLAGWLGGRASPSSFLLRTQAPGQGPRLFMRHRHVFSCGFPHIPVHWPRPCAAKVTLPDSSKVHPPNVLLPNPVHFRLQPEIGEGAQEHAHTHTGARNG